MQMNLSGAARPRIRIVLSLVIAAALGGCASVPSGTAFSAMHAPGPGLSRLYVYLDPSERSNFPGAEPFPVTLNGEPLGKVRLDGFLYRDLPAGSHVLTAEMFGYPGTSRYELRAVPGRTYFVSVKKSERAKTVSTATMLGGLSGMVVMSAITDAQGGGPVDFVPKDEAAGRAALAAAKQVTE